ncbi:MAG TPA: hypothetical protein V6C99_09270 [Oculatellaceae cyanobacterium]|jgi:glutathione synthase/RimK-type ligase-like ATP-grasp enzyme
MVTERKDIAPDGLVCLEVNGIPGITQIQKALPPGVNISAQVIELIKSRVGKV